jgi:hypothetical protein
VRYYPTRGGQRPWPRELFTQKLLTAEQYAGLEHLRGGVWHPFRRKWATERKDLPLVDGMAVGGWKDATTLTHLLTAHDERSMLKVMSAPNNLMGLGAG